MDSKSERLLSLYTRLFNGETVVKHREAADAGVSEKTVQRDIDDIRAYLAEHGELKKELVYDRGENGYVMRSLREFTLTNSEILAVCKILLESRSLIKEEMYPIIDKLLQCCVSYKNYAKVDELIKNEKFHYLEPHHGKKFVEDIWNVGTAVYEHRLMRVHYHKLKGDEDVTRLLQPVGLMFSEYYFYLCAYISASEEMPDVPKHPFPTIYRIDRIDSFEVLSERFCVPYGDRFQEGEFRKRVQFMFGGELRTIKFLYKGLSIESVLDRFPTAEVIKYDENGWLVTAEVYGDGVDIWLRGQGDIIEIV